MHTRRRLYPKVQWILGYIHAYFFDIYTMVYEAKEAHGLRRCQQLFDNVWSAVIKIFD